MTEDTNVDDDGLDFLGGDPIAAPHATAADEVRPLVCAWAAAALVARHPDIVRFRGVKGRRAWEQDLDLLMRRLHMAARSGAPDLGVSVAWLTATLAERGVDRRQLATAAAVLQEGLLRLAGPEVGGALAARLSCVAPAPGRLAGWLPTPADSGDRRADRLTD